MFIVLMQTACSATKFSNAEGGLASKGSVDDNGLDLSQEDPSDEEELIPDAEAEALCAAFKLVNVPVVANYSASHVRGKVEVAATNLGLDDIRGPVNARSQISDMYNLRGPICLLGIGADAATAIEDHRGRLEIVGVSSITISNTRGTLVIQDGHVESITKHRGSIRLINATVGNLNDVRGAIKLEGNSAVTGTSTNVKAQ